MIHKLLFIFALLLFSGLVNAGTEDVMFKLRVEYDPYLQTTCTTNSTNSSNQTTHWTNCSTVSNGVIKIIGGEDATHIMLIENLLDIIPGRIYTGYKTADLGNLSDITGINDKLEAYTVCNGKLNDCMDSNRNISSRFILLEEDSGLKSNFTDCSTNLIRANAELSTKNSLIKTKDDEIKSLEGGRFMWGILGVILGIIIIKVVIPKAKGLELPKSSVGNDHPPNPGYP